jgi:hypothetical protein
VAQPGVRHASPARGAHRRAQGHVARGVAALAALALIAAACGGGDNDSAAKKPKRAGTTTRPAAPPAAPLTGLPDPTGVAQTRPVLSVKVDNLAEIRPQAGLEAADIVWNEVVEGGITRLLAMYNSTSTDVVGPIRSVRLTDPQIVWPVGGLFVFSGGARSAVDAIRAAPVTTVDENAAGDAMFRDRSRSAPHNLFGRPDRLWAIGGEPSPPPALFSYAAPKGAPPGSMPIAGATIGYSGRYAVGYTWDAASGAWLRSTGGQPFLTRAGGQIAPQNVVVLSVEYEGGAGNEGAEARLVGSGDALVLRHGTATDATWTRDDQSQPIRLVTPAGRPIRLVPGRTWVELPDTSYAVETEAAAPAPPR